MFPLYKQLYNVNLKLILKENLAGFEIYSKAINEFKYKVLDIPGGIK